MHLKICVVGPKQTGKTAISNFLAGQTSGIVEGKQYDPTAGVRILEYEANIPGSSGPVNVELWDASGDHSYEGCWRAIMNEADGVLLVYNPDAPAQDQQIGDWFEFFVRKNNLREDQCMVFAHRMHGGGNEKFRPPPLFSKVNSSLTTPQTANDMKGMFDNFVNELYAMRQRK
eukprot:CAMPEP_0185024852 /NCGR_PEP_ID=MMETSP1103-20130426/8039_1 /TAXON_ID=36769 /ORGANISM="Paraphysomonas bandaiensis, Strain Caron Lab Isolate" /LENGTH=172 /DNA_ID=CAMNT_0027557923 /DNA_START=111 /DNA_END=629 /DNA_ORIENTATION=-